MHSKSWTHLIAVIWVNLDEDLRICACITVTTSLRIVNYLNRLLYLFRGLRLTLPNAVVTIGDRPGHQFGRKNFWQTAREAFMVHHIEVPRS